jgi:hypothetical protein
MKQTLMLLVGLLLVACTRAEPTVPPRHEMPPLATAVPFQVLPVSHSLLSPTELGDGWRGEACPVSQPFFCLYEGDAQRATASLSFSVFLLSRNQIMLDLLADAGLAPGRPPLLEDEAYIQSAQMVLQQLAEQSLANTEQEAAAGHTITALPWQPVAIGPLPGKAIGYLVLNEAEEVVAYMRFYAAFDQDALYWFDLLAAETAVFASPDAAVDHWQPVETAAVALLSELDMPPPVVASDIERVRIELMVNVTAVLGEGFIQNLSPGTVVTVLGQSSDGDWLYIACPENSQATRCWIPNDSGRVRPR